MANETKTTQAEIVDDSSVATRYLERSAEGGEVGVMVWYPIDIRPKACTPKTDAKDRGMPWYGKSQHNIHANLAEKIMKAGRMFKVRGMLLEENTDFPHEDFKESTKSKFASKSVGNTIDRIDDADAIAEMEAKLAERKRYLVKK